jgi:hypothetical protein
MEHSPFAVLRCFHHIMTSLTAATKESTENPVVDETRLAIINGEQNRNARSD